MQFLTMLNWMFRTMYKLVKNTAIGGLGLGGALLALMVAFQGACSSSLLYCVVTMGLTR